MENITYEGWILIGLCVFLISASIAMSIHIMKKYPPEPIISQNDESSQTAEPILGDVGDDDD